MTTDPTAEQPATPGEALRRAIQMASQLRDAMIGQHDAAGHALAVHTQGEDCSWCVRAADECDGTYACQDWKAWQAQYEAAMCIPFAELLGRWADELDAAGKHPTAGPDLPADPAAGQDPPSSSGGPDLDAIEARNESALGWVRRGTDDGWLPLSVREHFETDTPALVAELRHQAVILSLTEQERLWNRRAYEDTKAKWDELRERLGLAEAAAQRARDELDDLSALATRLASAVEFVAGLDRPLTNGGASGTNERTALRTMAADAHRAGLLPAQCPRDCESYEPCHGACCGPGQCTCSTPPAGAGTAVAVAVDENGTAYLDDDTEVPAGEWEPAGTEGEHG